MTDEQFGKLYELLRLCDEKDIDLSIRHRIASEIVETGNIDLQLQTFWTMVEEGSIPATSGIPREITLLSDNRGYGLWPTEDEDVIQRLTIDHCGNVCISYYNNLNTELRKERFSIPAEEAAGLLRDINSTFAICAKENTFADREAWELTIINTAGQSFTFNGPLCLEGRSSLTDLSENLRDTLDRPTLLGFDGAAEELFQFVSVCFDPGGKAYCYLADDPGLAVGDMVEVPVGDYGRKTVAAIVAIEYCTAEEAPYPIEDIKEIIRKIELDLPSNLTGTPFEIIKEVVDALDPEGLLDLEAPSDEYDTESSKIANIVEAGMSTQQIAKLMTEIFSSAFADRFDTNYFMAAATRIKEALESPGSRDVVGHCEEDAGNRLWRWCLVGNIIQSHDYGETHEIKVGTKQFRPGARVYIAPAQWGDGYERVCVIGKPRHKKAFIEIVMKMKYIENFRLKKVVDPGVLNRIANSPHTWWGNTDSDRETILRLIASIDR